MIMIKNKPSRIPGNKTTDSKPTKIPNLNFLYRTKKITARQYFDRKSNLTAIFDKKIT